MSVSTKASDCLGLRARSTKVFPKQFDLVADHLDVADALEVVLDNRASLARLLSEVVKHIRWKDVPHLTEKEITTMNELFSTLGSEHAIPATDLEQVLRQHGVQCEVGQHILNSLCDAGEIVVASNGTESPLYLTFERWSREVERLDMRMRRSTDRDGRISPCLEAPCNSTRSIEARIEFAIVGQLVGAGYYSWEGEYLVRTRARRLTRPVRCFVSHASADKSVALAIAEILRSRSIDVWLDDWEIKPGESIVARIEDGLDASTAVIALLSPDAVRSKWVQEELRMATYRKVTDSAFSVVPIIVDDCEVPGFLRGLARLDWREDGEFGIRELADQLRSNVRMNNV